MFGREDRIPERLVVLVLLRPLANIFMWLLAPVTDSVSQSPCSNPSFRDTSYSSSRLCHHVAGSWPASLSLSPPEKLPHSSHPCCLFWEVRSVFERPSSSIWMDDIPAISEPLSFLIYIFIFSTESTF